MELWDGEGESTKEARCWARPIIGIFEACRQFLTF
jgi:hypothetical protein